MFLSNNLILWCQKILPVYKRSVNGRPIIRLCTIVQSSFALFSKFCFFLYTLLMLHIFHVALFPCFASFMMHFPCVLFFSFYTFSVLHYFRVALFSCVFPCCTIFILLFLCALFSCFVFLVLHCHLRFF